MKEVAVTLSVHEGQTDNLKDCTFTKRLFETGECLLPTPGGTCFKIVLLREQGEAPAEETQEEPETPDLFSGGMAGSPAESGTE